MSAALPPWAQVSAKRRAHIERVAGLIAEWADAMGVAATERGRWLKAAYLHDALRDAPLADQLAHGPAAADRAAREGETDQGVLDAVRYHTVGYAGWDDAGRMLYLADFLEPGRTVCRGRTAGAGAARSRRAGRSAQGGGAVAHRMGAALRVAARSGNGGLVERARLALIAGCLGARRVPERRPGRAAAAPWANGDRG